MAGSVNKVMLLGRLVRDPECRTFSNGGKVANFGFAVTGERKKDPQTGKWEDSPCFLDCSAFNRGDTGKMADLIEQYLKKGSQAFIEGHLVLDQWQDKDGQKRSKIKVVVDSIQFLDPKQDGNSGSQDRSGGQQRSQGSRNAAPGGSQAYNDPGDTGMDSDSQIPF